jgi:hypothetical protein
VAVKCEVGTWTGSGSSPQTITLADGSFGTPIAIIAWMAGQNAAPAAGGFASHAILSMGFGTRRSGSTQQGAVGIQIDDNVNPSDTNRRGSTSALLLVQAPAGGAEDYTVSLDSFGTAQFTVSYSSAANASGDLFHYIVLGGTDLTDAIVLNWTMDSTGATEVVTGTGFLPSVMFGLDLDSLNVSSSNNVVVSFGCATSSTKYWSVSLGADDNDTMTSSMRWTRALRTDAFLERLTQGQDTTDARWDLDSFDTDGATLGVVDAPSSTVRICPLLFVKGGVWEAGTKAKATGTGDDVFTLANGSLTPVGVLLATTNQTAAGIATGDATMCLGAGSTPHTTRGSAVNNCLGITGPENLATTADRFRATDAIIEELTGGTSPAETSEAWFDSVAAGSFTIDWAVNGGSAALIGYLAVGSAAAAAEYPSPQRRSFVPMSRSAHW